MAIVGSSVVVGKILVRELPVFVSSALRYGIASVLLFALLRSFPPVPRAVRAVLFWQALTGVFLFSVFLLYGLQWTTAAESGVITAATPAVMALLSWIFLRERPQGRTLAGMALAIGGIGVLHLGGSALGTSEHWLGTVLVFGAVVGEALFTLLGKVASRTLSPLAIAFYMAVLGFGMFLPFAIPETLAFDFGAVTWRGWAALLYYAAVVTVAGFVLWYRGVAKVEASTAAVFTGVLPVSAVLLAHFVLGEELGARHAVGIVLVLVAIALVSGVRVKD